MPGTYGNGGPGGGMGDQKGGTSDPPKGGSFALGPANGSRGWITSVFGRAGDVPESVGFRFTKGDKVEQLNPAMGKDNGRTPGFDLTLPGEVVAYAYIRGIAGYPYESADALVYGFRYPDSYP